jgi:hypothetical protein
VWFRDHWTLRGPSGRRRHRGGYQSRRSLCARKKRLCAPVDTILTPGIGYSITPFPQFLDRLGIENRVHSSDALEQDRREAQIQERLDFKNRFLFSFVSGQIWGRIS